jgi:hypothetical protein
MFGYVFIFIGVINFWKKKFNASKFLKNFPGAAFCCFINFKCIFFQPENIMFSLTIMLTALQKKNCVFRRNNFISGKRFKNENQIFFSRKIHFIPTLFFKMLIKKFEIFFHIAKFIFNIV